MLQNFQKIRAYNPYRDCAGYFVPVLTAFMFGFYTNYPFIMEFIAQSRHFHTLVNIAVVIVLFTVIGRVVFEVTSYILSLVELECYKLARQFSSKQGVLRHIGKALESLIPVANGKEISHETIYTHLSKNNVLNAWHSRLLTSSIALQTGLGVFVVGLFVFEQHRGLLFIVNIILLFLALHARGALLRAELEIEQRLRKQT